MGEVGGRGCDQSGLVGTSRDRSGLVGTGRDRLRPVGTGCDQSLLFYSAIKIPWTLEPFFRQPVFSAPQILTTQQIFS
jgi:hypothetical protein